MKGIDMRICICDSPFSKMFLFVKIYHNIQSDPRVLEMHLAQSADQMNLLGTIKSI